MTETRPFTSPSALGTTGRKGQGHRGKTVSPNWPSGCLWAGERGRCSPCVWLGPGEAFRRPRHARMVGTRCAFYLLLAQTVSRQVRASQADAACHRLAGWEGGGRAGGGRPGRGGGLNAPSGEDALRVGPGGPGEAGTPGSIQFWKSFGTARSPPLGCREEAGETQD